VVVFVQTKFLLGVTEAAVALLAKCTVKELGILDLEGTRDIWVENVYVCAEIDLWILGVR